LLTNKRSYRFILVISAIGLSVAACETTNSTNNIEDGEWLIPVNQIVDGGPGRDGIPSIDDPAFAPVDQTTYVLDERRVIGVKIGDEVKAYPHQVMDWHEIVNDEVAGVHLAVTYCPLTNTAIGWNREIDGTVSEFGVSGLLFRNNLIPFDRRSDSEWSQMQMRSVHGPNRGKQIKTIDLVETKWTTWKEMYPDSRVLTTETGFTRPYGGFEPYGRNYLTDDDQILFPINNRDDRLGEKERVHGIIGASEISETSPVKVYVISKMGQGVNVIHDQFEGINFVVVGSTELDFMASFERSLPDGTTLTFEPVQNELPVVMEDQEGNRWNIFGNAVSGPRSGTQLSPTNSYTGFWFAWADFYPGLEIFAPHR